MEKIFQSPHRAARRAGVACQIMKYAYCAVPCGIVVWWIAKREVRHKHHNHKNPRPVPILYRRGAFRNRNERTYELFDFFPHNYTKKEPRIL